MNIPSGRQDHYLFGYPSEMVGGKGTVKCFRSTKDFWPHFFWLMTDPNLNRDNCACELCHPRKPNVEKEPKKATQKAAAPAPTRPTPYQSAPLARGTTSRPPSTAPKKGGYVGTSAVATLSPAATLSSTVAPIPSAVSVPSAAPVPSVAPNPTPSQIPNATPISSAASNTIPAQIPRAAPNPTAAPTSAGVPGPSSAIALNSQPDEGVLFREGEVVWFRKANTAFHLGVILKNLLGGDTTSLSLKSRIKPLAHYEKDLPEVERGEVDMRPFLTYSVPAISPIVQANRPMETVHWGEIEAQLVNRGIGADVLGLEASKVAAVRADHAFSLFNILSVDHARQTTSLGGVFLGCEKVALYEGVRVRVDPEHHQQWDDTRLTFVMVVQQIKYEHEGLHFFGNIFLLQEFDAAYPTPQNEFQLPPSMTREKNFRNAVKSVHGKHFDWVAIRLDVWRSERFIKGRFYESSKLGPVLYPEKWDEALQTGEILSVQNMLNNRFDSKCDYIGIRASRLTCLAGALPPGFVLDLRPLIREPPPPERR